MKKLFLICCFAVLFFSCSDRPIGYGVVNWSLPEHNLLAGDIVPVYVKSNVSKAYIIGVDNETYEVPLWQLSFFTKKKKAEEFKSRMTDSIYLYGRVKLDGLPMRKEPENLSDQVYRLREGEIVKLLWKGNGVPVLRNNEPLPGDWYEVLTTDGSRGWCFSYNLDIFDEREEQIEEIEIDILQEDAILADVLSKDWYPESYAKMLTINKIDLDQISEEFGFFPGAKTGVARVVLNDVIAEFPYTKITKNDGNVYKFEGTNLSIQVRSSDRISVQFTDQNGLPDVEYFVTLNTTVDSIVETEIERRAKIISTISRKGPNFISDSYGTLKILEDGSFSWSGYKAISPSIIPKNANSDGKVSIKYFVSPALASAYDGVLSFKFDTSEKLINFLYKITPNGLELEFIDQKNISDNQAQQRNSSPVILFFAPEG